MASDRSTNISDLLDPRLFGPAKTVSQVVSGPGVGGAAAGSNASGQLTQELLQLGGISQAETETLAANTQAINQSTTQRSQSAGASAEKTAYSMGGGLGLRTELSPLISGLVGFFSGLFGGGSGQESVPGPFLLPPSVRLNGGIRETAPTQPFAADYAAGGAPRPATSSSGGPQITVQVQALDSQSFLDHSDEIAAAVRQAMLRSNALSDVIREV